MAIFPRNVKDFFMRFFGISNFSKIVIEQPVVEDICEFAKNMHPKEFVALLEGKIMENTLRVSGLYYQPFVSGKHTASMRTSLSTYGSVHSHPSSNLRPSQADLRFFNKRGMIHLIIGFPYREQDIALYDFDGNALEFSIAE